MDRRQFIQRAAGIAGTWLLDRYVGFLGVPSLSAPATATPNSSVAVTGTGFDSKKKMRLLVVGASGAAISTTDYFRARHNGTFTSSVVVGTETDETIVARYYYTNTSSVIVATKAITVEGAPPPPPPTPSGRVDAPVTTDSIAVPSSVDSSGLNYVDSAFAAFLATVPNGRIINFPTGGVFKFSQAIKVNNRSDLRFELNGSRIVNADPTQYMPRGSAFLIDGGSSRIYVGHGFHTGSAPAGSMGTTAALDLTKQDAEFAAMYDAHDIEIEDITTERAWGDGIYLGAGGGTVKCTRIWWHDSTVLSCGRNGVAIEYADEVWIERVSFTKVGLHVLDIEPDSAGHGGTNVEFIDNPIGTYGHTNHFTCYFFAADGAANSVTTDVNVQRNTVVGNAAGINGTPLGLNTTVVGPSRSNIFVRDNTAQKTLAGPVMRFTSVAGVTVTHNVQPLGTGVLSEFISCTGVTSGPNP